VRARLETALRVAAQWQEAPNVDGLARTACADLLELIPADGAGWNEIDLRSGRMRILAHPVDYFPRGHDRLAALLHENPLLEHRAQTRGAAHAISDFVSVREYHRRQIYCEVYREYAVEDQLGAWFHVDTDSVVAVAFNRDRRSFTVDDRVLLDLLVAHIAQAFRSVVERAAARDRVAVLERALDEHRAGVVVLDRTGRIETATSVHGRWFAAHEVPRSGVYRRDDAELTVRRVAGDPPLLLLDERRLQADPETARRLGLTAREAEIVALAGTGLTNPEIATRLVIAERTVHKHLENAYEKLGVHSRTAAARLLLDA
jgi:DNA-binding CsgD family transcriptional regulator